MLYFLHYYVDCLLCTLIINYEFQFDITIATGECTLRCITPSNGPGVKDLQNKS